MIAYLTDWDLVNFLSRMGKALKEGGVIIIKDNACSNLAFIADKDDCDITTSHQYLRAIIIESGLKILSQDDNDMIQWHIDMNMLSMGMSTADREMEEALSLSLKELLAEHRGTRMAIGDVRRQLLEIMNVQGFETKGCSGSLKDR